MDSQGIPATQLVAFDPERDMEAILRMWSETGWWDNEDDQKKRIPPFFRANDDRSVVGLIDGSAECAVHRALGTIQHGTTQLSLGGVTAVTTSRIARRRRLASRLTARTIAHLADEGCAVAMLGMFDQGFYDRFGFGTGSYVKHAWVYPGALNVPVTYRAPERFELDDDLEEMHAAIMNRMPVHGGVKIGGERMTSAGLQVDDDCSFFGYRTDGEITHFMAVATTGEHGPDRVEQWAYQTREQCLELLRLVQEWGDQVDVLRISEPNWLQVQDFIVQPGANYRRTQGSRTGSLRTEIDAWWQARIVDLPACVAALGAVSDPLVLTVRIDDPIAPHLVDSGYEGEWAGLAGTWRLQFGESSMAERVGAEEIVDLATDINSLTRWWLGVLPAATLLATGAFDCAPALAAKLDELTAHLPFPDPGWDF